MSWRIRILVRIEAWDRKRKWPGKTHDRDQVPFVAEREAEKGERVLRHSQALFLTGVEHFSKLI